MDNLTDEKLKQLYAAIDRLLSQKAQVLVAIDGPCTAGKTTLSGILAEKYGCNVVHMDSFFLRPEQRTPERLSEPGGNVDYERFFEEVLLPLSAGVPFTYRPFSCASQRLAPAVTVTPKALTVIEGTYALHPYFRDPYDLRVFLSVDPPVQRQRIGLREVWKQERFFREWIPMEQRYFQAFALQENCDMVL